MGDGLAHVSSLFPELPSRLQILNWLNPVLADNNYHFLSYCMFVQCRAVVQTIMLQALICPSQSFPRNQRPVLYTISPASTSI